MRRLLVCVGLVVLIAVSVGGCVSPNAFKKSNERIETLEKEIAGIRGLASDAAASVKKLEADFAALRDAIDTRLAAVQGTVDERLGILRNSVDERLAATRTALDERLAPITKKIEKAEADAAAASNQLPALKNEITRFEAELKEKSATVSAVQDVVIRNLNYAREIYKQQYEAIDEALRELKKRTQPGGEPAPK